MERVTSLSLIVVMVFMGWVLPVQAEIIKLKSGEVINAPVVERTDQQIKVLLQGVQVTYFSDEIESIKEGSQAGMEADPQEIGTKGVLGEKEDLVNLDSVEVHLKPPAEWRKQANIQFKKDIILLKYQKEKESSKVAINVTKINPAKGIKRALDFVKQVKVRSEKDSSNFVFKEPVEVSIGGLDAAFIEYNAKDNSSSYAKYYFLIGRTILSLQLIDNQGTIKENLDVLKGLAKSIRVVP